MEQKEPKNIFIYKTLFWTAIPLLCAFFGYTFWVLQLHGKIDKSNVGTFGDAFGVINALFTGLAFLGAVVAVLYQARELKETQKQVRLQTEALKLQTEELASTREEVRLQTIALNGQELEMKGNRLEQELSRALSLVMQHVQIIRSLQPEDVAKFVKVCMRLVDYFEDLNLQGEVKVSTKELHQKFPALSTSAQFEKVAATFKSFFATFNSISILHLDYDVLGLKEAITRLKQTSLLFETANAHIPMDIDTALDDLSGYTHKIELDNPYLNYNEGGKVYSLLVDLLREYIEFQEMEDEVYDNLTELENQKEEGVKSGRASS